MYFFSKYVKFYERQPMLQKRAFFSAIFSPFDSFIYAIGGNSGTEDLQTCEKYNITKNQWFFISPMKKAKNGASGVCIDTLIFVFGG